VKTASRISTPSHTRPPRTSRVQVTGESTSPLVDWFTEGLRAELSRHGHAGVPAGEEPDLVLNRTDAARPRPFRRKSQATFLIGIVDHEGVPENVLQVAYPILVRSLSNLLVFIARDGEGAQLHFVTLEQGTYTIERGDDDRAFFEEVYRRVAPLASSRLVINNRFDTDLPADLWEGTEASAELMRAGRRLDEMNLLPAPFPIMQLLGERDRNHIHRLFGIGGLSYGNLSARHDATRFWMSARGVDKSRLREIGRDVLLITDYLPDEDAIRVSVPPRVEPRAASVDAIEHWMLYTTHPEIAAIIHIHAWMDDIPSTTVNYPCGTAELAREVAEIVAREPDPSRTVVGLKNHGLTITGRSLEDIFQRIEGRVIPHVPMD
jgi:ribulose-5-phosphate 4-epimerase/fuculose-1-phosphate aldolase